MKKILLSALLLVGFIYNISAQSCCPEITKSSVNTGNCIVTNGGSCGMCKDATVSLSLDDGKNLPVGGQLSWYYGTSPTFNPAIGQGTLIGTVSIPSSDCDNASGVKFNEVMVKPANNDDDMSSPTTGEWIELIGPPGTDISCYIISDGDWAITIPPGYSIPSDGLFVIGFTATAGPEVDLDVAGCGCTTGNPNKVLTLDNNGEWLAMFDGTNTIDAFQYGSPSLLNTFPFGDLISGGTIPGAMLIGCVQNYSPGFPSFTNYSPTTPTGQTYSRKPDFSGAWAVSCPTIGKCNTNGNSFPLTLQASFSGLNCNQTIYLKALLTPTPGGCNTVISPTYSLFISCPESEFKKSLCAKETININGTIYDSSNPSGTEIIPGGSYLGCDSIIHVNLNFNPEVTATISGDFQICLGQSVSIPVSFTGTPPFTFTYKLNGLPLNTVTTSSNPYILKFNPPTSGEISLSDLIDKANCEGETFGTVNVDVDAPTATLSGKKYKVCEGDTVYIPVNLFGYPDFKLSYALNGKLQNEITTSQLLYNIPVVVNANTIITIKEMTDDQGCQAKISGQDTIIVTPKIKIKDLTETCYPGNTFDVTIILSGGDSATWKVIGPGTLKDSIFTSSSFTGGSTYKFIIKDTTGCSIDTISNTVKCNCLNAVGTMDQTTLNACVDGTVNAIYNTAGQNLGPGDILMYILHENPGNSPGKIWAQNATPDFGFVAGMTPGIVYYISAVIGKENPPGQIDLSDECLQTAKGTPVIFHDFPSVVLSPDTSVCVGNCVDLSSVISGNEPFDISYDITTNLGTNTFNSANQASNISYTYCPPTSNGQGTTTFTITTIKDKYCTATFTESIKISVGTPTTFNLSKDLCYGQTIIVNGNVYSETNPTGTELLPAANQFGCDSTVFVSLSFVNTVIENLNKTICEGSSITINGTIFDKNNPTGSFTFPGGSVSGCDSVLNVNLFFYPQSKGKLEQTLCAGESLIINGKIYDVANPSGFENLAGKALNGCDSLLEVNLIFLPPVFKLYRDTLCKGESVVVNGTNYDVNKPAGLEIFKNASAAGCDSTVQVQLVFVDELTATLTGPDTICTGQEPEITIHFSQPGSYDVVISDGKGQNFSFTGITDGFTLKPGILTTSTSIGFASVVALTGNCSVTLGQALDIYVGSLPADILAMSDYNGYNISCNGLADGSVQAITTGGTAPFSYLWSGGQTTNIITGVLAGTYTVTITDAGACSVEKSITLTEPQTLSAEFKANPVACNGTSGGSITIIQLSGGTGSYTYRLNGTNQPLPVKDGDVIPNLAEGTYLLSIEDKNGCSINDNIIIEPTSSAGLFVDAGADVTIEANKQWGLEVETNLVPFEINWNPARGLDCINCLNPVVKTDSTTTYTVVITDKNGCTATDSITVFILSPDIVYIPNVFSPDGDGINDRVTVYAGNRVKAIRIFEIFDRWGEKVFSRTDMPANEPEAGWDGKHRGQKVQEGVYVYYLLIELTDGKERLLKGDISLIR